MSNLLFMCSPVEGHFNPMLPIAKELINKGHRVVWITGTRFKERIEQISATFKAFPAEWDPGQKGLYDFYPELKKLKGISQLKFFIKDVFLNEDRSEKLVHTIDEVSKTFPADILVGDRTMFIAYFKFEMENLPSIMISQVPLAIVSKDTAPFGTGIIPGKSLLQKIKIRSLNFFVYQIIFSDINKHANMIRKKLGLP